MICYQGDFRQFLSVDRRAGSLQVMLSFTFLLGCWQVQMVCEAIKRHVRKQYARQGVSYL